ncbi:ABC transporter substrate-binding protein [Roseomonas sp. AR75]|uniref:ABC transporter substrate-binding protein n=1 Tax=Roseomonas sp. AR75 TaxID=2562311 RepID=UPI0010BFB90A|nr:ABC transporter substrate-binding protein [Roseomonas sp. AR75]
MGDQSETATAAGMRRRDVLRAGVAGAAMGAVGLPAAAQAQGRGGRIAFANGSAFDTMDPHATFDVGRVAYRLNLYDGLLRWLDNPPKLEPWLAESYTVSEDGKQYVFKLRQGVKFHDGTDLTAEDVVYSMERILAVKKGAYPLFATLIDPGTTKARDRLTVEFNLKEASAIFAATTHDIYVVNSALVKRNERNGDWGQEWISRNDAGSGSYILRRFDPARGFLAQRFDGHFLGAAGLQEIDFRYVAEVNSRVLGLIRGDFQGTDPYMPQDQITRLQGDPNMNVMEAESTRLFYATMHHKRPPFTDVNFRKAVCHCFDYDGWINNILSGSVVRNTQVIPNPMWGAPKDVAGYNFDIDKAKWYLQRVQAPMREIVVAGMVGYEQSMQAAALLQNGLTRAGIQSRLVNEPWPVVSNKMRDPEQMYDMLFLWRSTYYADPHNWAGELLATNRHRGGNASYYSNPEVDRLLAEALANADQAKRAPLYEQIARISSEDAACVFIHNTKWYGPFRKNVQGVRFCPIGDGQEMRWLRIT